MFSRTSSHLRGERNALYQLRDAILARGDSITDLISGIELDPAVGFPAPILEPILEDALRASRPYRPDPRGRPEARAAISSFYRHEGFDVPAEQVLLTPGSSLAYWYCFKLLADPGDEVLCPRPSYPLFDTIAELAGIRTVPYHHREEAGWAIDLTMLEHSISNRTRAIIVITPHNPTGHVVTPREFQELAAIARRHRLAIICDEVFSPFLLSADGLTRPPAEAPLAFVLNGFSKMFGLAELKLGWLAVRGDRDLVDPALDSLETISDTFLPVGEGAQAAVAGILEQGRPVLEQSKRAVRQRYRIARDMIAGCRSLQLIEPDGGFYCTARLKAGDEEEICRTILSEEGVLLHPGYLYDMEPHHLVLSFVREPAILRSALSRRVSVLERSPSG